MKKLVFAFICLLPVITSRAQIITVDDDGPANHNNIPDAINEAIESRQDSNIVDVETIVVKPGTYNKKISFNNLAVTLTSEDPNDPNVVQATIITVSSGYSVRFDFGEDSNSVLTGFTVTGRGIHCRVR